MKKRTTFDAKEKRRDQRRPVSIDGMIDGVRFDLIDISLSGLGARTVALGQADGLELEEDQEASLTFTAPDNQQVTLAVTIRRIDHEAGEFGATFARISDQEFDAIEKLMFPCRGEK
ncbi:MAG: hypothetical protein GKS02_06185 [Alphaproteobacteria bacterium]|nr:hypothetical protein [Alphaproteobacteria bacterium]